MKRLKYAPTLYTIAFVEIGDYYTETIFAARSRKPCTLEEAKKEAKDAGYQVIEDLCYVVPTTYEVEITVAVEPEYIKEEEEEEEEVTWTEIMNKAWHLALNSGTFTDNPEEKAGDVYLVKDIKLVVDAFAKDIEEGKLISYSEPAEFLDKHGIEWE